MRTWLHSPAFEQWSLWQLEEGQPRSPRTGHCRHSMPQSWRRLPQTTRWTNRTTLCRNRSCWPSQICWCTTEKDARRGFYNMKFQSACGTRTFTWWRRSRRKNCCESNRFPASILGGVLSGASWLQKAPSGPCCELLQGRAKCQCLFENRERS